MQTLKGLKNLGLINAPKWLPDNVCYEVVMGSVAYGVSSDTSDIDLYGFCIPPKKQVFPHFDGYIPGFGRQKKRFQQYQQHHIYDKDAMAGKGRNYDITIYNIVKFFQLAMENNPNIVDCLFVPVTCILHSSQVGELVRENRRIFLHKGCWHKFKGYAYSQLNKISTKNPQKGSNRYKDIKKHKFDTKYAYHMVRLIDEVEQILSTGDLDLMKNREQLKSIRRGEWVEKEIKELFKTKEKDLEKLYHASKLPYSPDENKIKQLLLSCLEIHYGNIENCVVNVDKANQAIDEIKEVLEKYKLN